MDCDRADWLGRAAASEAVQPAGAIPAQGPLRAADTNIRRAWADFPEFRQKDLKSGPGGPI